jgi:hypothetical protein
LRHLPVYDGIGDVEYFVDLLEYKVKEDKLVLALEVALKLLQISGVPPKERACTIGKTYNLL